MSAVDATAPPTRAELRGIVRRLHRVRIESRSLSLEPTLVRHLARVERLEVERQLELAGIPYPSRLDVAKAAPPVVGLSSRDASSLASLLESFGWRQAMDAGSAVTTPATGERLQPSTDIENAVAQYAAVELQAVPEAIRDRVEALIRGVNAQARGEFPRPGPVEIGMRVARALRDDGTGVREATARDAARRFTNSVVNHGIVVGYHAAGIRRYSWLAIDDERSRSSHGGGGLGSADGLVTEVGVPFTFRGLTGGYVRGHHPGDLMLPSEERRWCRCTTMPE